MDTKPSNENLLGLIDKARRGKVVLPQFQRNFVWSRDEVTDLLVSILEGYFIGTFLMLDTEADRAPFAMRAIQGVDLPHKALQPEWMILDGQQRLTSLHYVFAAPPIPMKWTKHPYRFFLNLDLLAQGKADEAIFSERVDEANSWLRLDTQYEKLTIPFTVIEQWDQWLRDYENWLRQDQNAYDYYWDHHRTPWYDMIGHLRQFTVPVIEIPKVNPNDPEAIGQVCAIFEKMNSTGVALSVYDLLTARLYRHKIDLHALWEQAVEEHNLLGEYSGGEPDAYGIFTLRAMALMRGLDAKSKTLINLAPKNFEKDWERAAAYMERALERITNTKEGGFGVFQSKWFPYTTMVAPMAAALAIIDEKKLDHSAYKLLRRWYWSSVFTERYAGAVESTIHSDYQDMLTGFGIAPRGERRHAIEPSFAPAAIRQAEERIVTNEKFSLRDTNRVNAMYRGIMCLVALRGARDFRADDTIELHTLDDHHIFPQAYLKRARTTEGKPYPSELINCIVNRTLISRDTNLKISRMAPSQYLEKLVPDGCAEAIMSTHYIDETTLDAMRRDSFEDFLGWREQALITEIRSQITGE